MSPHISLIITVYNRALYLSNAIESVLAQTEGNFELIIWDDGSTDGSVEIAQRYALLDSRIRVFAASHQGRALSLQSAHAVATGAYVGWVDSDDGLASTAIAETSAVLDSQPMVGLVYTNYQVMDAKGELQGDGRRCGIPYSKERLLLDFMTFHFRLIRRAAFEAAGGIDGSIPVAVDYDLCLRLSEVTQVFHLERSLYHYRAHSESISQRQQLQQMDWSREAIARALVRRGLDTEWAVDLQVVSTLQGDVRGRFSLGRKALQKKSASTLHPWVRRVGQALTVLNLSLAVSSNPVWAVPIVPNADGINTKVNLTGDRFDITGGTRSGDGRNLFHSFKDFNLDAGQIANFVSDSKIQNILGRINGGNASVIDGLLKVSGGNSNLFLLNPSGIVFGKNAMLNVLAAFTATTANGIQFGGGWFSAVGTDNLKALNGSPVGFAFSGGQPGSIVNLGDLTVGSAQNLTLLGGTVLSTGSLAAPDGQVTVSAVPGTSYVRLSQAGQLLSLEVNPLSMSTTLPNADRLSVVSLPQLLTGAGPQSATGVTVNPDGTVQLTGSTVAVSPGDVMVKSLNAGTATITAVNTLSLVESQIATARDLRLSGQMVTVRDGAANPVSVKAGGNLFVRGDRGIDIFALNHPGSYAFGSGGNLSFLSDGIISGDAHFKSGENLTFRNLAGGAGKFVSLFDPVLYSGGDVDLGSYTGTSLKVEAGGNILAQDITITGPDTSGGIPVDDPDRETLTESSALILRGGLSEPASILSVGNVTAKGGHVELTTNGNIFTGNVDVSSNEVGTKGGNIKLKAFNIFTGDLSASSTSPITFKGYGEGWGSGYGDDSADRAGTISLEASSFLRTGNIDTSSVSGDGGAITIAANDAIVGHITASGSMNPIRLYSFGFVSPEKRVYAFRGGDVSVKALEAFHSGTITTDGVKKGEVTIDAPPPIPDSGNDSGSGSGRSGSESTQTNPADGASGGSSNAPGATSGNAEPIGSNSPPPDVTNTVDPPVSLLIPDLRASFSNQNDFVKDSLEETQSEDGLDSPAAVRRRILTFLEARRLAGEKWTAQAIAQKLGIPLEIAQIAVLNPIGQNIKVPIPDLSIITDRGLLIAQATRESPIDCWWCAIPFAVDQLGKLADWLFQSKSKDVPKDNGEDNERDGSQDQQLSKGESKKLDKAGENPEKIKQEIVGKKNSGRYDLYKDKQGNIYIKPKGGQGSGETTGLNINNF